MNKASIERGMGVSTHFTKIVSVGKGGGVDPEQHQNPSLVDGCVGIRRGNYKSLDDDGLPSSGQRVGVGDVVVGKTMRAAVLYGRKADVVERDRSIVLTRAHNVQLATVDEVLLTTNEQGYTVRMVKLRERRAPARGDKFSSRHGQKGTVGRIVPQEDMPYSAATGMTPDIIITPHAVPSRMTVAHLLEMGFGKAGATAGCTVDGAAFSGSATPESLAVLLRGMGLQPHGMELMIDGRTGVAQQVPTFMGPCYYQRLRHMAVDKFHARATGPNDVTTRQAMEGRAANGGMRAGEMERDAWGAHGASEVLSERLSKSADDFLMPLCPACGHMDMRVQPAAPPAPGPAASAAAAAPTWVCPACAHDGSCVAVEFVHMSYVYKLFVQENAGLMLGTRHATETR
jgi:DNA-directed RNA polymerase II subunit RPB2